MCSIDRPEQFKVAWRYRRRRRCDIVADESAMSLETRMQRARPFWRQNCVRICVCNASRRQLHNVRLMQSQST